MRRGLTIAFCAALTVARAMAATSPALLHTRTDPSRMTSVAARDTIDLPPYFAQGWEKGVTVIAWLRLETSRTQLGAFSFPSHSTVAARATLEGGDELPAFLDLASVPYGSGATWGATDVVPQDAAEVPGSSDGRFVVCVNCDTDTALTLTVGGSELSIPATNGYIRNLEICKGDASVAVSAASAGAHTSLALAVNPWVHFINGPAYSPDLWAGNYSAITNCWTMLCWRASLSGGTLYETFDLITRDGTHETATSSSAYPAASFVRDSRFRYSLASGSGMTGRRLDVYGLKYAPLALTDAEVWRVWELDLAEIRRRGIDTALPPR